MWFQAVWEPCEQQSTAAAAAAAPVAIPINDSDLGRKTCIRSACADKKGCRGVERRELLQKTM